MPSSVVMSSLLPSIKDPETGLVLLVAGEAWSNAAIEDLTSASEDERRRWLALLTHATTGSASRPSAKWLKTARELIEELPTAEFVARMIRWSSLADQPHPGLDPRAAEARLPIDINAETLKGLARAAGTVDDADLARALGRLTISAYRKLPGIGPRAVKVGNACLYALGRMPSPLALGQLALLKVKIKAGSAQKEIDKALQAAAERLGVPREEIEEMATPTYGLVGVGRLSESLGEFTAELAVGDSNKCEVVWRKSDGKIQKSVPAAVKIQHAEQLKDLKATAKDIEKMLPAQRDRLDGLFLDRKAWSITAWRERYFDHPLMGTIARRIIWRFTVDGESFDGIGLDGRIVNVDDEPLELVDHPDSRVELWHPIGRPLDDVLAWRGWLERHQVRQPFKQAHREVYLLTDAERRTGTYSNRFAAHVLRQHQFHALCGVRGWKDKLRLMVDDVAPPPSKLLPAWGLRAEFWVEGAGDTYGQDTTEAGSFLHLTTDQVRFYRIDAAQTLSHVFGGGYFSDGEEHPLNAPLPFDQIPPLALSEILRDVDLFVGVSSIANDPTWSDGGPGGRYRDYWRNYSFGDLTATARVRKEVLERLIPRLKIASRCSFDDKYLVVKGDLRSYKIHLGSGNILMTPNDEYLCIVPNSRDESSSGGVFLPFEGDRTLSIVLSKALMLADDTRIKDPTIVSQIRAR
jgi:hypothetical protein